MHFHITVIPFLLFTPSRPSLSKVMHGSSLVAQWVNDPALSLLWLRLLLWHRSFALELPNAEGMGRKNKQTNKKPRKKNNNKVEPQKND